MEDLARAVDERGIILSTPLRYTTLEAVVQCLTLSHSENLRDQMRKFLDAAGVATPQESRVPCDLLRAATLRLRKWRDADPEKVTRMWDDDDDAVLTAAWRDGLNAPKSSGE